MRWLIPCLLVIKHIWDGRNYWCLPWYSFFSISCSFFNPHPRPHPPFPSNNFKQKLMWRTRTYNITLSCGLHQYPLLWGCLSESTFETQDLQKQVYHLVPGCPTGEGIYFITNLRLSAFKANQWNNAPKSQSNFTTFCFSVYAVSNRLLCQPCGLFRW